MTMRANQKTADTNADEASGYCPLCGRNGLRVFLLRQAVITKNRSDDAPDGDYIYQELGEYAQKLNFANRMPSEALNEYFYILRTVRNGYIYVMQQNGDDVDSRIIQVYESIDNSLRLKNVYSVAGTKPRELADSCRKLYHSIPSAFIHLSNDKFTQAWVAYSQRAWSKETIEEYLVEQDTVALSRFTVVDLTTFQQNQSLATTNRAVPFKDIFGDPMSDDERNKTSKVLEFRFPQAPLPNFVSAHGFDSCMSKRKIYGTHIRDLNDRVDEGKALSSAIVLEDICGIAEELNTQRIVYCDYYFNAPEPVMIDEPYEPLSVMGRFNKDSIDKNYEIRAKNILETVNPQLKKLAYFSDSIFKKRLIKLYMDQYINGVTDQYDKKIAQEQRIKDIEFAQFIKDSQHGNAQGKSPSGTYYQAHSNKTSLESDKKKELEGLTDRLNQAKITQFEQELKPHYDLLVKHYEKYAKDYYIYVRWLFGQKINKLLPKQSNISQFADTKPSDFESTQFWRREFNFDLIGDKNFNLTFIYNVLYSGTQIHYLDEHHALWDELSSNPESILYAALHQDKSGFNLDKKVFTNIETNESVSLDDIYAHLLVNISYVATGIVAQKLIPYEKELALREKQLEELYSIKTSLAEDLAKQQQDLSKLRSAYHSLHKDSLPPEKMAELKTQINLLNEQIAQNKQFLQRIDDEIAQTEKTIESTKAELEVEKSNNNALKNKRSRLTQFEETHTRLTNLMTEEATKALKINNKKMLNSRLIQLHGMQYLANNGVFNVEFTAKARISSIEILSLKLTELQMVQFRDTRKLSATEQLAWKNAMTVPYQQLSTEGKLANFKFSLSFTNFEFYQLFIQFLNEQGITKGNVLNPHQLQKFISEKLPTKLQELYANQLHSVNQAIDSSANTITEKTAQQANLENDIEILKQEQAELAKKTESIAQETSQYEAIVKQKNEVDAQLRQQELAYSIIKGQLADDINTLKQHTVANQHVIKRSLLINGAINGFVSYFTVKNIIDNIKQLGELQPAEKAYVNEKALLTNVVSLVLTTTDMVAQTRLLYLNSRLLQQLDNTALNLLPKTVTKMNLMKLVSKGVNRIFAGITITNALLEIASTENMGDIEDNSYKLFRIGGGMLEIFGAFFLLASNPWLIALGLCLVFLGDDLIYKSYALNRWTPIQHWLNRIQFATPKELKHFKYQPYNENGKLSDFGHALNDYMLAVTGVEGMLSSAPSVEATAVSLPRPPEETFVAYGDTDVELFLSMPNFAFNKPNDYIICEIVIAQGANTLITLYYLINKTRVDLLPTITLHPFISNSHKSYRVSYNKIINGELKPSEIVTINELELRDNVFYSNQLQLKQYPNNDEAVKQQRQVGEDGTHLLVKKPIAKINKFSNLNYGLTIIYYQPDSDELPLVITKTGKL